MMSWRVYGASKLTWGRLANVYFDTAALPAYLSDETYPYPTTRNWLEEVLVASARKKCFGAPINRDFWDG